MLEDISAPGDLSRTAPGATRKLAKPPTSQLLQSVGRKYRAPLLGASSEQAKCDRHEIKARAASTDFDERAKAIEEIPDLTDGASGSEQGPGEGGRAFASYCVRHFVAQPGRCKIDGDQPFIAATVIVAAVQGSRSFDRTFPEACVSRFLSAGNTRAAGRRRGKQPGSASFLPATAFFDGMEFCGYAVALGTWALYKDAGLALGAGALRDMMTPPFFLHFLVWPL